jgi:hypothetical protein
VRAEWSFRYSAFGTGSGTTVHISGHGGNVNLGGNVIINGNVYIYGNVNMP